MTRQAAKDVEREHVLDAIRLLDLELQGPPIEKESPDFRLVLADGRRIGLEHTRAVNEMLARGGGAKNRLKERIQLGLEATSILAHVNVSLTEGAAAALAHSQPMLRAEGAAIVALAKLALSQPETEEPWRRFQCFTADLVMEDGSVVWRDADRDRGAGDLATHGVRFCNAVMIRPFGRPLATCSGSGWAQGPGIVQDAIDDKAVHIDTYRQSGDDEQWLLIVGSSGVAGSSLDVAHVRGEFISPFEKTLFLELFAGRCIELRTQRP